MIVFHFTLGLVQIMGARIQLLPLKPVLESHSGCEREATPFFALGILSAALLAMRERERERDPVSGSRAGGDGTTITTTTHILPLTDQATDHCFHDFRPPKAARAAAGPGIETLWRTPPARVHSILSLKYIHCKSDIVTSDIVTNRL